MRPCTDNADETRIPERSPKLTSGFPVWAVRDDDYTAALTNSGSFECFGEVRGL
jgi:hypothetical protein